MERVRKECPDVEWVSSYAILGPCDYLDIFRAKDVETASKVTFGHAHTEIWTATEWDQRSCGLFKGHLSASRCTS
jgi:hypothetical protein